MIKSLEAGLDLFKEWHILPVHDHSPDPQQPNHMEADWNLLQFLHFLILLKVGKLWPYPWNLTKSSDTPPY